MSEPTPTGYAMGQTEDIDPFVEEHVGALRDLFDGADGVTLDCTPGSLETLDTVIPEGISYPPEAHDDLVRALGCYVGEVCCETFDCTWDNVEGSLGIVCGDHYGNPFAWADGCLEGTSTLFSAYESFRNACQDT